MIYSATIKTTGNYSYDSGCRLGESLIQKLGRIPDACWLFCEPEQGLQDMINGIADAVSTLNIIGCTGAGEIADSGFSTKSIVLGGIAMDQAGFEIVSAKNLSRDSEGAGRKLAASFSSKVRYVQLFSDGITGNGCALLRGISSILGEDIPITGGTAGDAGKFKKSWQFAGREILTDAAAAIGFTGDFKVGTGIQSGWSPIGLPKKVTRSSGNILYELNNEPALKVFKRFLGKHADKLPAVGVEYPLGFYGKCKNSDKDEYFLLRATMAVNHEQGSIAFAGEIPEGTMVHLTCGDKASLLDASEKAARLALDELGEAEPVMAFFYSCMARKTLLGQRTKEEFERVNKILGGNIPLLGFYSFGEYCRIKPGGPCMLHNESAAISIIGI
ncbi:FIST domain-containing protein [Desulfonema limicola]|uniref:FIST domain-containing protein n=1 Tax=Desulfonema limicola TaxID=45656 RepID=A0A975GHG2_9BACT|nr:FIST N-terminal domain-containing protein [Desulfonema limicola]QTA81405.1 FIST domain-containing protein [Desulfonema limicola]